MPVMSETTQSGAELLREIINQKAAMARRHETPSKVRLTVGQWSTIAAYLGVKLVRGQPEPDKLMGIPVEVVA